MVSTLQRLWGLHDGRGHLCHLLVCQCWICLPSADLDALLFIVALTQGAGRRDLSSQVVTHSIDCVLASTYAGGKDQTERNESIDGFKQGRKDVLVATDVASKGLDFPDIQHVINYDMPEEIENYVHR